MKLCYLCNTEKPKSAFIAYIERWEATCPASAHS